MGQNIAVFPKWHCKHPFPPARKKPVVIRREQEISTIYGNEGHQVSSQIYISTDKIHFTDFTVPPQGYFFPPDIHGGDEVYYILEGRGRMNNPATGKNFAINAGDAFYIPKGAWHQAFNLTKKKLKILCGIAPKIWAGKRQMAMIESKTEATTLKATTKDELQPLPPSKWKKLTSPHAKGVKSSLCIRGRFITMVKMTISAGSFSEFEKHPGDEAIYVLQGTLVVETMKSREKLSHSSYEILPHEKFLVPARTKHRYHNFSDKTVELVFAVAPKL